jgi:hypothetical protein
MKAAVKRCHSEQGLSNPERAAVGEFDFESTSKPFFTAVKKAI